MKLTTSRHTGAIVLLLNLVAFGFFIDRALAQPCEQFTVPVGATCRDFYKQREPWDQEKLEGCGYTQVDAYKQALRISDQGWGNFLKPCDGAGTCSIGGDVTGVPLQGVISPDSPGSQPIKVRLKSMVLRAQDGGEERRAPLKNRRYDFQNVPAGATYEIFPGEGFRSDPARRTVTCKANNSYHGRDFRITGAPVH